ncbi:MAG: branched-chain amino acid ABC transporter permease, partial [Actinobacteria bacterium]|nr:branched-chain amino acid ABC transporter permease [Actinomycetota bacterium]
VEALDGVAVVEVDREKNSLIIDVADAVEVDDAAVIAAVDEAGYVAVRA